MSNQAHSIQKVNHMLFGALMLFAGYVTFGGLSVLVGAVIERSNKQEQE